MVVHHRTEYQHGGLTNTDQMCLLCLFDHALITEHGYTVRMGTGGRVEWIAPQHLDPGQTPRINTLHPPTGPHRPGPALSAMPPRRRRSAN